MGNNRSSRDFKLVESESHLRNSVIEVSIVRNGTVRKDAKIRRKRVTTFVNDLSNSKVLWLRKRVRVEFSSSL